MSCEMQQHPALSFMTSNRTARAQLKTASVFWDISLYSPILQFSDVWSSRLRCRAIHTLGKGKVLTHYLMPLQQLQITISSPFHPPKIKLVPDAGVKWGPFSNCTKTLRDFQLCRLKACSIAAWLLHEKPNTVTHSSTAPWGTGQWYTCIPSPSLLNGLGNALGRLSEKEVFYKGSV